MTSTIISQIEPEHTHCRVRHSRQLTRVFLLLWILGALFSCQRSDAPTQAQRSKIVFLSNRDRPQRQFDIFTTKLDDSEPVKLTPNLSSATLVAPRFSPDQSKPALASEGFENKLQLMNTDGSDIRTLTEVNIIAEACFSPTGNVVVFVSKAGKNRQIHLINLDGSNLINLSNNEYDEFEPSFSPDGSKIVFTSSRGGKRSVCLMNTDGSNQIQLTEALGNDSHPAFSPDGKQIVFASVRDRNSDIYLLDLRGSLEENQTNSNTFESEPLFSPDGSTIFFISNVRDMRYRDILAKDIATGEIRNLTKALNFVNQNISFSSDGKNLIFESLDAANSDVYVMGIDGRNLRNLTPHTKWDCAPSP
jgi:TolB protein